MMQPEDVTDPMRRLKVQEACIRRLYVRISAMQRMIRQKQEYIERLERRSGLTAAPQRVTARDRAEAHFNA